MARSTKETVHKYYRKTYVERRNWINSLKSHPCLDCKGTFDPVCMQFDHVRGKKFFTIGSQVRVSLARLLDEIAKCELVCSNCHALRHKDRRGRGLRKAAK